MLNLSFFLLPCYENVDKHLEEVRFGRSRLGNCSCRKTRGNCQLISSDILLMSRGRHYTPLRIFLNIPCIIQVESLVRTYLLPKNGWGKQRFCISAE